MMSQSHAQSQSNDSINAALSEDELNQVVGGKGHGQVSSFIGDEIGVPIIKKDSKTFGGDTGEGPSTF